MTARLSRRGLLAALGSAAGLAATGCAVTDDAPVADRLVVAGGERGGTLIRLSRLLSAELVRQRLVTTAPVPLTAGSSENLDLLLAGRADLGPCHADVAVTRGDGLVALARSHQTTLHCLVRASSRIRRPEQLVGRRVAVGPVGSGTSDTALRLLDLLEPGRRTTEAVNAAPRDAAISVAGGTVDAMFWWGGLPAAEILSVDAVEPFRPVDLSELLAPANAVAAGVYEDVRIPGQVYGGPDVRTLGVACHLLSRADLDDDVVTALVDLVRDPDRTVVPQPSTGLRFFTPGTLYDTTPVPLHPAAAARYRASHG